MHALAGPNYVYTYAQLQVGTGVPNNSFCQVDVVVLKLTCEANYQSVSSLVIFHEVVNPEGD